MTVRGTAEGSFQDGAFRGAITDENDLIYSYNDGIPLSGNYTISWSNGVSYEGDFQNGLPHGQGVIYYEDGSKYEGEFKSGKPDGRGKMSYSDGSIDIGEFRNGYSHGECTRRHKNGEMYKGRMDQGESSGYGIWYFADGGKYEGEFVQGRFCGKGIMTFAGGIQIQGEFMNDALISSNGAQIGDAQFILELFGLPGGSGNLDGSSLGVVIDFLKENGYGEDARPLIEVHERMKVVKLQEEAEKIHEGLMNEKKPWLLLYGTIFHTMGLNLVPNEDSVIFEFFNSGEGLDYHLSNGKKYQTMLRVQVPKNALTQEKVWELLLTNKCQKKIKTAYKLILELPGVIKLEEDAPVWQSPQCDHNCGMEWIFAYLIHKMPRQRYNEMRLKLCETAIARAKLNPDPKTQQLLKENEQMISEKLERKRKRVAESRKPNLPL